MAPGAKDITRAIAPLLVVRGGRRRAREERSAGEESSVDRFELYCRVGIAPDCVAIERDAVDRHRRQTRQGAEAELFEARLERRVVGGRDAPLGVFRRTNLNDSNDNAP